MSETYIPQDRYYLFYRSPEPTLAEILGEPTLADIL